MKSICVYCGSSPGNDPRFLEEAIRGGTQIAQAGLTLVYGGGKVGLMGAVADAALAAGGKVVGVMPEDLVNQEIAHKGLSELHVVKSMHERKLAMADLSDGFLCLPGGPGTFEEIFEQWTWALLGIHAKPCGFVNVGGYYDLMRQTIQQMADNGFIAQTYVDMLVYEETTPQVLEAFQAYVAPPPKWSTNKP
ncbi:MAG: TIGR00730 family Rossman fold protein [Alphaproteobacteria bacterium]|nr:TIGR00730 family Rossman fold protein [Alphaproteobacteria bacterium]MBU1515815.1 TIGR00730 family Rossman fold protein [Alphaproteobacteria bacterium]MBU2094037.1 TIGR00730 family Rossman fold protein [Alphaproteobacteria bacterium]MBU2151389.1 TIGR00730 family Rossman fold protein [Alphaproteobacteria bacterium]MBU2308817.1 TIGR00730 family Rossman fold protein [Alphaproteobacteria bacterium]